ncbi:MAG TPA: AlkA N-terminal domain-containing protein [Steroidobacteraceae bacterium]|nr:AlkA N-terminal domain-containing protein [Steroidobacteraceae bacterium]
MHLPVRAPFHLEATVRVLQRRPANLIDRWEAQRYRRAIRLHGRPMLIEVGNSGTIDTPDLELTILGRTSPKSTAAAARLAREILGLDLDPSPPQRRAEAEPALRATARALKGMRPPRYPDLLETFANVIPFQQVSLEAGMAVVAHLVRRFGEDFVVDGRRHHLFPSAQTLATAHERSLRACGMSTHKSRALSAIAKAIAAGDLSAQALATLPSREAMERLMQLSGIGPWSAALVLLRGFRRLDVFPRADTGAEGSLARLLHLRSKSSLARVIERFGDFRGYLYFYGLASRLLEAGLIRPVGSEALLRPSQPHGRGAHANASLVRKNT